MEIRKWVIRISLFIIAVLLIWSVLLIASQYSIKLRYIAYTPLYFPFDVHVPSHNSLEAKKRGSFLYEYQIPSDIEYKDCPVEIGLKEVFLEYEQYYKLLSNKLVNREDLFYLVLVYTERGKELSENWNKTHYYFKMGGNKQGRKCLVLHQSIFTARDSIFADTLVLELKEFFYRDHRPHPTDVTEIWKNHCDYGTITLIKKDLNKKDSAGTKWFVSWPENPLEQPKYFTKSVKINDGGKDKGKSGFIEVTPFQPKTPEVSISSHKSKQEDTIIHRYRMPPEINYHLNLVQLDFKEVFLEKGENYNLVFVYSKEGKRMAREWNQKHGYHKLSWEKNGRYTLPLSPDTPLDTLLADTPVVNLKHLFKENPRYPQPDHVRKIWDEFYQFGTITLVKE